MCEVLSSAAATEWKLLRWHLSSPAPSVSSGDHAASLHILGGCLGLRGLPAVRPSFPGTLQGQSLLLVHHDVIHPLVRHAAARTTVLLLPWRWTSQILGLNPGIRLVYLLWVWS